MKAIEQYFPVVLFIMLYKVAVSFESVEMAAYNTRAEMLLAQGVGGGGVGGGREQYNFI